MEALVQHSTEIIIITDRQFSITFANDTFTRLLGVPVHDVKGQRLLDIAHEEDKVMVAAWLLQLVERPQGLATLPLRLRASSGEWIFLEATGRNLLDDPAAGAILIYCRDVQARHLADQALARTEQRLTMLLNNTRESFIILDQQLRVSSYNKAAQEHSVYFLKGELQSGLSFFDLLPTQELDNYIDILDKVLVGHEMEQDTWTNDEVGNAHIFHHTYRPLRTSTFEGVFITSTNITEKRLATLALKENEERFKSIIEYSFDAVVIITLDADILYASPSIEHMLGFNPDELTGRNSFEFIHPDDAAGVHRKLVSIIQGKEETYIDYRSITKSGGYTWVEAKGKNMTDNPHIRGVLVSLRDVSERKRMLNEQTELANELIKYNKDLQQFSFITSHNLRSPVANLMGLLALYDMKNAANPLNLELVQKMHECTVQMNDTLNDLVNVLVVRSKPNTDTEYVRFADVAAHVRSNVDVLLSSAGGKMDIDFTAAEGITYNKLHLESIFINLVTNSIKYADPTRPLRIGVTSVRTDRGIQLSFSDNGLGIDLDRYKDRIFGLYQRFHSEQQGKGLGLYMIKSQVTASGGSIEVESEPGVGTTFHVLFPVAPVPVQA